MRAWLYVPAGGLSHLWPQRTEMWSLASLLLLLDFTRVAGSKPGAREAETVLSLGSPRLLAICCHSRLLFYTLHPWGLGP